MLISGTGWELHVVRLGLHVRQMSQVDPLEMEKHCQNERTYGTYQVYRNGQKIPNLSGNVCESSGYGDKIHNSGNRIAEGRYPLSTHFSEHKLYQTIGYSNNMRKPGDTPMPALLLEETEPRDGILIHPGHPPCLYVSSVGCLNPTRSLSVSDKMDFWDSRSRVMALIDDLRRFAPVAFRNNKVPTLIDGAWAVIEGEPTDELAPPAAV
jgi:hypothetical protein